MSHICEKCGKEFPTKQKLERHHQRKRPCDIILSGPPGGQIECEYCKRSYSRQDGLKRHLTKCIVANSSGASRTSFIYEHELRAQRKEFEAEFKKQNERMKEMAKKIEDLQNKPSITVSAQITVVGFDSGVYAPTASIRAAFTENPVLVKYSQLTDHEKVDPDKAAPYVLEAFLDLIKRTHQNPAYRNVYVDPGQKGWAIVYVGGREWEARPLEEAIRSMFNSVAGNIHKTIVTSRERELLPLEVQGAVALVPNLYEDEPERFIEDGKGPMEKHLTETRRMCLTSCEAADT